MMSVIAFVGIVLAVIGLVTGFIALPLKRLESELLLAAILLTSAAGLLFVIDLPYNLGGWMGMLGFTMVPGMLREIRYNKHIGNRSMGF